VVEVRGVKKNEESESGKKKVKAKEGGLNKKKGDNTRLEESWE